MTEPLVVDPMRLDSAAAVLGALSFPQVPPAITATGSDAVSAAINATMPVVESPMIEGMPAVQAALAKTASSIAAAADMYADTDQALAESIPQDVELAERGEGGARTYLRASAVPAATAPDSTPPDGSLSPQFTQAVGTAGSLIQSIQSGVQGFAGDAKRQDPDPIDQAQADAGGEGAAAGATLDVASAAVPETVMSSATSRETTTKESS